MSAVFISDLHIDRSTSARLVKLGRILETESRRNDAIYILGDLVEMWVGDDDDDEDAQLLRTTLAAASANTVVKVMHGNRDFLFGQTFADATGVQLIADPTVAEVDGRRILLAHGDAFCTEDTAYQQMRAMFRSQQWQEEVLGRTLQERRQLAAGLRAQSMSANANKAQNIMDVTASDVVEAMQAHDCDVLIHGHTHRPGIHDMGNGRTRYVLGQWQRCGWLARAGESIVLECFSA